MATPPIEGELLSSDSAQVVLGALDEYRAGMSSTEARERFVAALVARLFSEEQLRLLRNARIENEEGAGELIGLTEALTPQQLAGRITTMLEANPSWPDRETLAELGQVLGRRSEDGGGYVPLRREQINEGLRLTRRWVGDG